MAISYFKQVMEDGFFHADPHPGNILINNGKICFIDFGMIGELSNEFISRLNNVIIGLVIEDIDIAIPPLEEQMRIANKVSLLFSTLDKIAEEL